jgi:hypothetical protein
LVPTIFWQTAIPIRKVSSLDTLRNIVLERAQHPADSTHAAPLRNPKRLQPTEGGKNRRRPAMPKWKFLTPNGIVISLQPKIKPFEGFQGMAELQDEFRFGFRIIIDNCAHDPDDDEMTYRYWGFLPWSIDVQGSSLSSSLGHDLACSIRDWTINILEGEFASLRPEMMLQPSCLLCGHKLTDPISQARWIGPECNDSAAALNPFIIKLTEAAA